ncbi:MAG: PilC/PilY family type IV pilus protein, partial [Halioglobus sp.]
GEDGALDLAYIFPTQRRGGRMTYALDVTDPNDPPDLLWRVGCPSLANDTGCTSGFSDVGQSWSMPVGGYVKAEDEDDDPVLVAAFGGGFDDCLNEDVAAYPSACSGAKGKGVYIVDASNGSLLKKLDTDAPVITELSPIDINFDGYLDFAYAADVRGNLYRISFATMNGSPLTELGGGLTALAEDDWSIVKIAATEDDELRFYNAPTAAALKGIVAVALGSGDRERPLERNYPYSENVQNRFYTFFDEPAKTFVENPSGTLAVNETTTVDLDGDTMLAVEAPSEGEEPQSFSKELDGWYMDLADRGEQVANPAAIGAGKVFFNTFQPGGTSNGLCSRPLGIGTGYAVNLFGPEFTTGTLIDGPGIPIPPVIATVLIPPGLPPCDGVDCPEPPEDPCAEGDCEYKTVCIGCDGFEPVELIPDAPPIRRRIFFTENGDN